MDDAFSLHEVRSPIVAVIVSVTLGYWILLGWVFALFSRFYVPGVAPWINGAVCFLVMVSLSILFVAFLPVRLADGTWTKCRRSLIRRFPLRRLPGWYDYYQKVDGHWTRARLRSKQANTKQ